MFPRMHPAVTPPCAGIYACIVFIGRRTLVQCNAFGGLLQTCNRSNERTCPTLMEQIKSRRPGCRRIGFAAVREKTAPTRRAPDGTPVIAHGAGGGSLATDSQYRVTSVAGLRLPI